MDAAALTEPSPETLDLEQELGQRLSAGLWGLQRLPGGLEQEFRRHARTRAAQMISQSIYLLVALFLLVVVPISCFSTDPALRLWQATSMLPIAVALLGIWLATQSKRLNPLVEEVLGLAIMVSLTGTLYGAMVLGTSHFGQMAAFETIYILIIAFSILRLPTLLVLQRSLLALALALGGALMNTPELLWLNLFLYFAVPLLICAINGYMLEHSERRAFVQNWLLGQESARLAQTQARAEQEAQVQQQRAEFQSLIAGNLSRSELFGRSLRFLLTQTHSLIGAAYRVLPSQQLELISQWGAQPESLQSRERLPLQATLMGPAITRREILQLDQLPADYLPIRSGGAEFRPGHILIVPVFDGDQPVAVLELGKFSPYSAADRHSAQAVTGHFAHAVLAAEARANLSARSPAGLALALPA